MAQPIRVAVIIHPTWHVHREALLGVAEVAHAGLGWQLDEHWPDRMGADALAGCAGIICGTFDHRQVSAAVAASRLPTVGWSRTYAKQASCVVVPDDEAIGQVAADHLLAQGYTRFAFLGEMGWSSADDRRRGLTRRLREHGHAAEQGVWSEDAASAAGWLLGLPSGTGLLLSSDSLARAVVDQIEGAGRCLGTDLGVLGVNADPFANAHVGGRLSSIRSPWREVGAASAAQLARMLGGRPPSGPLLRLPPGEVVRRMSTVPAQAILDGEAVLAWIGQNAHRRIDVGDLVAHTGLSRRTVERQIRRLTGCSPSDQIRIARVELAKGLLGSGRLAPEAVAQRCGFTSLRQLTAAFRAVVGVPPAVWQARRRDGA
jgi:LacI family transcriptional regulator